MIAGVISSSVQPNPMYVSIQNT